MRADERNGRVSNAKENVENHSQSYQQIPDQDMRDECKLRYHEKQKEKTL